MLTRLILSVWTTTGEKGRIDFMLINSLIGENTVLRGEFDLKGVLRIDGVFHGNVQGEGKVLIGENGESNGDISANVVIIGGKVKGNIIATEMVSILSTGTIIGNMQTPRLIAEEGMIFDGKCIILKQENPEDDVKLGLEAKKLARFTRKSKSEKKELINK